MKTHRVSAICSLLLFNLFTSSLGLLPPVKSDTENHEKVMGAFTDVVNSSLFYQSYMPLILKFRVPDWKVESLRLNKSLQCANDDFTSPNDPLCPIAYHFEGLLTPLAQTMRFYKNVFSTPGGDFYERNFSCDKIKPHFLHFSAQLGGLLPYLNEFRNRCPLGKNATLTVKNLATSAAQHAVMAFEKYKQLHEDSIKDKNESEWKFLDMASYAALQNSYVFSQYVDSVRWANAFTSCQSYRLDVGLVSPVMLNDSLSELSKSLYGSGYTFSLPFLSSLPHYYKIPLVDCILTLSSLTSGTPINAAKSDAIKSDPNSTANLIVRLLIPVVKIGVTHKIVKLNKIPYIRREGGDAKICEIQNFQPEDVYLVEQNVSSKANSIIGRVSPFCLTSKLCKVPEVTHRQVVDPCVTGIITKNQTLTSQFCFFDCSAMSGSITSREKIFPIFTQLSSNKYAITGLAPDTLPLLFIQCHGQTTHMFKPNTNEGVIFVTLSCNCELTHGVKKFPVQQPCDDAISVEHVMEFAAHHHHDSMFHDEYDSIDYAVDPLDAKDYNLTFGEVTTKAPGKDGTVNGTTAAAATASITAAKTTTNSPPIAHGSSPPQQAQLHCGHVLLWIFLITLLLVNLFTILILYKNGVISFNMLYRGHSGGISRLTNNEIPVSNMNSGSSPM